MMHDRGSSNNIDINKRRKGKMRCRFDRVIQCIVGKYEWCINCETHINVDRESSFILGGKETRKCIMCELVNAIPQSYITNHHLIPLAVSEKHLSHKIGYKEYLCLDHHQLFNLLIEPLLNILDSKSPPFRGMSDMTYWFINVKLPDIKKRINKMVYGVNRL